MRLLFTVSGWFVVLLAATTPLLAQPTIKLLTKTVMTLVAKDEKTRLERPARFDVETLSGRKTYSGQGLPGRPFSVVLEGTDTLIVTTSVQGYGTLKEIMLVSCDTCASYAYVALLRSENDSLFTNLEVNQAIQLDKVYFDQSSYVLRSESYPQLDKLVKTLATFPRLKIEIAGHTDNVGDRLLNQALSENRARIITNYLVSHQIASERLRYAGYGSKRPAAPNDSEENKRRNRRVEFIVLAR